MTLLGAEHGFLEVFPHQPDQRRADREVILLLHGTGGSKDDWRFPRHRDLHWDFNHAPANRHDDNNLLPPVDLNPLDAFSLSDLRTDIRCWTGVLTALGHTVINYSQDGKQSVVEVPLVQFAQRIVPFIRNEVLTGRLAGKRVIVLAHSRGGILARAYLHSFPDDGQQWMSQLITMCSPHQGTFAPRAKKRLADLLHAIPGVGTPLNVLLNRLMLLEEPEAAVQLLPDDPLFDRLANPADVPAIRFLTIGGSSVRFTREYFWSYTPDSYVPNFADFPDIRFDWTRFAIEIPLVSPMFDSIPNAVVEDEQDDGRGDGLVSNQRSRLPGAPHESFPINHAEALWDEPLFSRIADLLGTPLSTAGEVVCGRTEPGLRLSPSAVTFGSAAAGTVVPRTVQVTNGTGAEVRLTFAASQPNAIFRWPAFDTTLPDGETATFTLEFHPADSAIRTELLRITGTDPDSPHELSMTGKGVGGFPTDPTDPLPTTLNLPPVISFGSVTVGGQSERPLVIGNNTGHSVRVHINASPPGSVFRWPALDTTIAHASERRLTLTFRPASGDIANGRLIVESDLPSSPVPVALTGKGPGGFHPPGSDQPNPLQ